MLAEDGDIIAGANGTGRRAQAATALPRHPMVIAASRDLLRNAFNSLHLSHSPESRACARVRRSRSRARTIPGELVDFPARRDLARRRYRLSRSVQRPELQAGGLEALTRRALAR
jgi:hypothetical protein